MPLSAGVRLGPYEILAPLGSGGMGEVYRGRDTRLERSVAIKVLPEHFSRSPDLRQRFEREAKAVSSLNHSHICTLHDVGEQDGIYFLVMEYLEGETLADRVRKGPLPTEQVLRYATEIADALDKAHRQGVIHRDLKPGNIMLTKAGAKLLDFGLAKLKPTQDKPAASVLSELPTAEKPLTGEGTILGTFQYMAPEQLEGREADARTDIWALGTVIYEMATGKRAFTGKSQASLIAAILEHEPEPITTLQPMTPPALDRLVRTCLAKDPDERWQTAHDVTLELRWTSAGVSQPGLPATVSRGTGRERVAWVAAAALLVVVGALGVSLREAQRSAAGLETVKSAILPPEDASFGRFVEGAVSRDGKRVAFVATGSEGKTLLWVRPLGTLEARVLPDTQGASYPFWSPDSRFLGFFGAGKLRKIDASGGPVETLCDAPEARGGAWSRNGTIVFAPYIREPLYRISAAGGTPAPVTQLDASRRDFSHRWPSFLPDGRRFLYFNLTSRREDTGIYVGSLDSRESRFLLRTSSNAVYAPPGHLLLWREGSLMAQAFDADRLALAGEAVPVAEKVAYLGPFRWADFSVSANGVLVYRTESTLPSKLVWLDRGGREVGSIPEEGFYRNPHLSPDGERIALIRLDPRTQEGDIWLLEAARGTATRFTFEPGEYFNLAWSPDGDQIAFNANRTDLADLYQKESSGAGPETLLLESRSFKVPSDWSSDGRFLLYQTFGPKTGWDVWTLPLFGDRKATPFLETPFLEGGAVFSPSGRYIAYTSNESGRSEVYVRPFPGPGGVQRISSGGGSGARWRRDGKELYYISPDRRLMAVEVQEGPPLRIGASKAVWEARIQGLGIGFVDYDVSPDGQRFLVSVPVGREPAPAITLVLNWPAGLKR